MAKLCYNPIKGIDDVIANKIGSTKHLVANLRGLYDEQNFDNKLDLTDNVDSIITKLQDFQK